MYEGYTSTTQYNTILMRQKENIIYNDDVKKA